MGAGNGNTRGMVEQTISETLDTYVINCAKGGASADDMYKLQNSCSQTSDCTTWSIMTIGMNQGSSDDEFTAEDFVKRELDAGKKVIIQGHPDPRIAGGSMPSHYDVFMDSHAELASSLEDVYFI